jgi:hypothetical protein
MESPSRSIEVFAYSGGDAAITLTIHGPLEYKDMINVGRLYVVTGFLFYFHCRKILKAQFERTILIPRRRKIAILKLI